MGSVRFYPFFWLCCVAILPLEISQAQFQPPQGDQTLSSQRAYYQPRTSGEYQRHLQQVANTATDVIPARQTDEPRPPKWLSGQSVFSTGVESTNSTLDRQPPDFTSTPAPHESFDPSANHFPRRVPATPVGIRRLQDDPFGEKQKPVKPAETPPTTQLPGERPETTPGKIPDSIDPFADPPSQDSKNRDPLLPPDAEFSPTPGDKPNLPKPKLPKPSDEPQIPTPVKPQDAVVPPGMDRPDRNKYSPPIERPMQLRNEPELQDTIDYHQGGNVFKETYRPPQNTYSAPPVSMPPIVHPGQTMPYDACAPQIAPDVYPAQPLYQTPPIPQPSYQPFYEPIPGVEPLPTYHPTQPAQPQPAYSPPQPFSVQPQPFSVQPQPLYRPAQPLYLETKPAAKSAVPMGMQPEIAAPMDVYSSVVAPSDCTSCGCETECPNFYFSFFGGWTGLRNLKSQSGGGQFLAADGTGFSFALGRRNGRNLRTEIDFSFLQNELSGFDSGSTIEPLSGELTSFAGTANAYWEFIDAPSRCFKPYLGLGVGFISIHNELRDARGQNMIPVGMENDTSLAYQWMGGINYKAYRNMDLFAEYRYLGADTYRIDTTGPMSDRYTYKTDNVFFGLRWKF